VKKPSHPNPDNLLTILGGLRTGRPKGLEVRDKLLFLSEHGFQGVEL
jgi:hypothetical protein